MILLLMGSRLVVRSLVVLHTVRFQFLLPFFGG